MFAALEDESPGPNTQPDQDQDQQQQATAAAAANTYDSAPAPDAGYDTARMVPQTQELAQHGGGGDDDDGYLRVVGADDANQLHGGGVDHDLPGNAASTYEPLGGFGGGDGGGGGAAAQDNYDHLGGKDAGAGVYSTNSAYDSLVRAEPNMYNMLDTTPASKPAETENLYNTLVRQAPSAAAPKAAGPKPGGKPKRRAPQRDQNSLKGFGGSDAAPAPAPASGSSAFATHVPKKKKNKGAKARAALARAQNAQQGRVKQTTELSYTEDFDFKGTNAGASRGGAQASGGGVVKYAAMKPTGTPTTNYGQTNTFRGDANVMRHGTHVKGSSYEEMLRVGPQDDLEEGADI